MAKKAAPKKPKKNSLVKVKGLFDHLNQIRETRNPKYFSTLSEADKKTWSTYMIVRALSMQTSIIDMVNEIQVYYDIAPEYFYQLCLAITPSGRNFFPFIKNSKDTRSKELIELLCKHFQDSKRNILKYLEILSEDEIEKIVMMYGHTEKEAKKILE